MRTIVKRAAIKAMFKAAEKRLPRGFFQKLEIAALNAARGKDLDTVEATDSPKAVKWNAYKRLGIAASVMPKINTIVISLALKELKRLDNLQKATQLGCHEYIRSYNMSKVMAAKKHPAESLLDAARRIGLLEISE